MGSYHLNEDPAEYLKSPSYYISQLLGAGVYNKLENHFGDSVLVMLQGRREQYKAAGLTDKQADMLVAVKALASLRNERVAAMVQIRCSMDCYKVVSFLGDYTVEHFVVVVLNRANKVLGMLTVSIGGLSGTVVDTKVLFSKVLSYTTANSIILSHNHPSGNLAPSESDLELTKKIVEGGKLLDIKVLDHIIVSGDKYLSFADEGYL
jgi:DNA repair protein RadC